MASDGTPGPAEVGLSHIALVVTDADASISFYERYAGMRVVHRRVGRDGSIVWLSDLTRPFAIVLIESPNVGAQLEGIAHLGTSCASRQEVDRLCALARGSGCLVSGPKDAGSPVGYWALLSDPDGHNVEISHGQEVGRAVHEIGRGPYAPDHQLALPGIAPATS